MQMAQAEPQDRYVNQLPGPERIILSVPPIPLEDQEYLQTHPSSIFRGDAFHLKGVVRTRYDSWRYEERNEAQRITPYLWIGPFSLARDPEFVTNRNLIFAVLIRHKRPGYPPLVPAAVKTLEQLNIPSYIIDVFDNRDLIASFPGAIKAINDRLAASKARTGDFGQVFISCQTGNDLSAALGTAYLLEVTTMQLMPAFQFVHHQRFSINLDDAMRHTLACYYDIIQARRTVGQEMEGVSTQLKQSLMCDVPARSRTSRQRGTKRDIGSALQSEEETDGDIAMGGQSDAEGNVRVFVPFTKT